MRVPGSPEDVGFAHDCRRGGEAHHGARLAAAVDPHGRARQVPASLRVGPPSPRHPASRRRCPVPRAHVGPRRNRAFAAPRSLSPGSLWQVSRPRCVNRFRLAAALRLPAAIRQGSSVCKRNRNRGLAAPCFSKFLRTDGLVDSCGRMPVRAIPPADCKNNVLRGGGLAV